MDRFEVYDICSSFELDHIGEIFMDVDFVDRNNKKSGFVITMTACGFVNREFSPFVSTVVEKPTKKGLKETLIDMHAELFDR